MLTSTGRQAVLFFLALVLSSTACARADAATAVSHDGPGAPTARTLIRCGALFDAARGTLLGAHALGVESGSIVSVVPGPGVANPGDTIIELAGHTCMPGWIDLHVHLTYKVDARTLERLVRANPADHALMGAANARTTLRAGFTTVRNLGDLHNASIALRDAVEQGLVEGPRIVTAGEAISSTGGHADYSNGLNRRLAGEPGPLEGVINSPDDAYRAVRQRYKDGADLIKVTATGGLLSLARNGHGPHLREAELESVVQAAHDYGMKVAAHAHGIDGIRRALRAGVDTIEHGTFLDDETIAAMKRQGTWYVPTAAAVSYISEQAQVPGSYPEVVRAKLPGLSARRVLALRQAAAAGVRIAFGSDAGPVPHGENAREFVALVDAGLTPAQALQAATAHAAEALGESARLGTLDVGKAADIVAVRGDPLADITLTRTPSFVMKGGRVVVAPGA